MIMQQTSKRLKRLLEVIVQKARLSVQLLSEFIQSKLRFITRSCNRLLLKGKSKVPSKSPNSPPISLLTSNSASFCTESQLPSLLNSPNSALQSDTWIDFFATNKKNIDFFTHWHPSQFPRKKLVLPRRKKTLVIDLDETLVHSTNKLLLSTQQHPDFDVELVVDNQVFRYFVFKRPHVEYFLAKVSSWFNLAFFTASVADYADPVIEWLTLPVRASVQKKLFRASCTPSDGVFLKNLALVEPDLSQVLILDNSVAAFELNPDNGVLISTWIDDRNDEALLDILPFLDALRFVDDVRSILGLRRIKEVK